MAKNARPDASTKTASTRRRRQQFLSFGQSTVDFYKCPECQMIFTPQIKGEASLHRKFHTVFLQEKRQDGSQQNRAGRLSRDEEQKVDMQYRVERNFYTSQGQRLDCSQISPLIPKISNSKISNSDVSSEDLMDILFLKLELKHLPEVNTNMLTSNHIQCLHQFIHCHHRRVFHYFDPSDSSVFKKVFSTTS